MTAPAGEAGAQVKICTWCGQTLPLESFSPSKLGRYGRRSRCKPCMVILATECKARPGNAERAAQASSAAYHRRGHNRVREGKYRLTAEHYRQLLEQQGGGCAICRQVNTRLTKAGRPWRLAVDHDHSTGAVRGLLCDPCNTGLGSFGDNDDQRLLRAAAYLEQRGHRIGPASTV